MYNENFNAPFRSMETTTFVSSRLMILTTLIISSATAVVGYEVGKYIQWQRDKAPTNS